MATLPSLTKWPYGCPSVDWAQELQIPMQRMEMQSGNSRQRRMTRVIPTRFGLSWTMRQHEAALAVDWLAGRGTSWFEMSLPGVVAGIANSQLAPQNVRLLGNISTELVQTDRDGFWLRFSGEFESVLTNIGRGAIKVGQGGWIIGGGPITPSTGLLIAGGPAAPSSGQVIGGTPQNPSISTP